jgi:hypothetical protein
VTSLPDDEVSTKLRMEDAAKGICSRTPGATWEWINAKALRIWNAAGAPIVTLHLEKLQ